MCIIVTLFTIESEIEGNGYDLVRMRVIADRRTTSHGGQISSSQGSKSSGFHINRLVVTAESATNASYQTFLSRDERSEISHSISLAVPDRRVWRDGSR